MTIDSTTIAQMCANKKKKNCTEKENQNHRLGHPSTFRKTDTKKIMLYTKHFTVTWSVPHLYVALDKNIFQKNTFICNKKK